MKAISKAKFKKLEKNCIETIIENNIVFMDEIFIFSDITPSLFELANLKESQQILDTLEINRAKLKRDLRIKWFESTNATLNAALYKLICTEEERRNLSASAASKQSQVSETCTQEEYLKSLKEMGEGLDNAD